MGGGGIKREVIQKGQGSSKGGNPKGCARARARVCVCVCVCRLVVNQRTHLSIFRGDSRGTFCQRSRREIQLLDQRCSVTSARLLMAMTSHQQPFRDITSPS